MTRGAFTVALAVCVLAFGTRTIRSSNAQAASRAGRAGVAAPSAGTGTGMIRGHIVLSGKAPGNTIIRMGMDPKCSAMYTGKYAIQQTVLMGENGSLANVFVWLEGSLPETPVPTEPVVIDQRACMYSPRVVGVRIGQVLQIRNDDSLLHNVHSSSAVGNSFNTGQPMAGMVFEFKPKAQEVMLKIACDVHQWMIAYVGVAPNPYFAVTGTPGTFEMSKVPPGTYTLRGWHERFGELSKRVTVKAGTVSTIDFNYSTPL